jgi:subtilisin family serine protease
MTRRLSRVLLLGGLFVLCGLLLANGPPASGALPGESSFRLGKAPQEKLDGMLRLILARDERARAGSGTPVNLATYGDVITVYGDKGRVPGPRTAGGEALKGKPVQELGLLVTVDGNPEAVASTGAGIGAVAGNVVTVRATLEQLRELAALPNVVHIAASYQRQPAGTAPPPDLEGLVAKALDISRMEVGVDDWHNAGFRGEGVIVGVVDTGIDFLHRDFRMGSGNEMQSRIAYIWDQADSLGPPPSGLPAGFGYGTEWTNAQINTSLGQTLCPPSCLVRQRDIDGHGTHVTGIAAGDGSSTSSGFIGMAPKATIISVNADGMGSFADIDIVNGVDYIFRRAQSMNMPAVVNLSLGGHFGPHDGTSPLEQAITSLGQGAGRSIIIAAGNEGGSNIHAGANLGPGGMVEFTYNIPVDAFSQSFGSDIFNGWYNAAADVCMSVRTPNNFTAGPVCKGDPDAAVVTFDGCVEIVQIPAPFGGDNELITTVAGGLFECPNSAAPGTWTIKLEVNGSPGARVDFWGILGINPFNPPHGNNAMTIGIPGTADGVITVASYVTKNCWPSLVGEVCYPDMPAIGDISPFSSRGPRRGDTVHKPDIAAPGQNIFSVLSADANFPNDIIAPDGLHVGIQGTSMAAPHVAGMAALLMEQNPNLNVDQLRSTLNTHAINDSFTGSSVTTGGGLSYTWGAGKARMPPVPAGPTPTPTPTPAGPTPTPTPTPSPGGPTATPSPTPGFPKGDVNCDNQTTSVDALFILRGVAGLGVNLPPGCPPLAESGDINCDDSLTSVDALLVLRKVAGLAVTLPPGCLPI